MALSKNGSRVVPLERNVSANRTEQAKLLLLPASLLLQVPWRSHAVSPRSSEKRVPEGHPPGTVVLGLRRGRECRRPAHHYPQALEAHPGSGLEPRRREGR